MARRAGPAWRNTFRPLDVQGRPLAVGADLPDGCGPKAGPELAYDGHTSVASPVGTCERGLIGGTIRIDGPETTRTGILERCNLAAGSEAQTVGPRPDATAFEVPARRARARSSG